MVHDELLDVVDGEGNKIGVAKYSECHRNNLLHLGAMIIIYRDSSRKEVLLQKRSDKVEGSGKWCFPGGHIPSGISIREGLIKEIEEEVFSGSSIPENMVIEQSGIIKHEGDENGCNMIIHLFETEYGNIHDTANEEVDTQKFVPVSEMKKYEITASTFLAAKKSGLINP